MIELLLTLLLVFIFNDLAIFGFYAACDFEYGNDLLEFDCDIESGSMLLIADGVVYHTIEDTEVAPGVFAKVGAGMVEIPRGTKEIKFDPQLDSKITISNVRQKETINKESKEIFWFIKYYSKKWLGDYWCNPIACCPVCMSSLHSAWGWIPIYSILPFTWWLIYIHAIYILALAGLNKLILTRVEL